MNYNYWREQVKSSLSEREVLNVNYRKARWTLLGIIIIITLINGLSVFFGDIYIYFKISAIIPYYLVLYGMGATGILAEEFSDRNFSLSLPGDSPYFIPLLFAALTIVALYILFWCLSKKGKSVWLIAATVLYAVDTVSLFLLKEITVYILLDVSLHAIMLFELINGIIAYKQLEKKPTESIHNVEDEPYIRTGNRLKESTPIRYVENDEKAKIFIEASHDGHRVILRRRRLKTELVIDGRVYDEFAGLIEYAHTLKAVVGGCRFTAAFDGKSEMILKADGKILGRKAR